LIIDQINKSLFESFHQSKAKHPNKKISNNDLEMPIMSSNPSRKPLEERK